MSDLPSAECIDAELDDVLSLVPLISVIPNVADQVFVRLVDALVDAVLHDIRERHTAGAISRGEYLIEMCTVVAALQESGLLERRSTTG